MNDDTNICSLIQDFLKLVREKNTLLDRIRTVVIIMVTAVTIDINR
jgi:hypothetical protein